MSYGRVIFGDNQFLGVNHASQFKAAELYARFDDIDQIIEVLGFAYEEGIRDFMFTTHHRYEPVFEEIRRSNLFRDMYFTPCLPYAHKYWNKLAEGGFAGLISSTLGQVNPVNLLPATLKLLFGRFGSIVAILAKLETLMCKGLPVRGVFLQNLAFDFLVSMELYGVIEDFADFVSNKLGVSPGFITMNHPSARDVLCNRLGLAAPWICANYNVAGFRMNPSKTACEESFAAGGSKNIAMSVMASGASDPSSSLEHVLREIHRGHISAVLFGSSSRQNISQNARSLRG
jgi:hypothetical protein